MKHPPPFCAASLLLVAPLLGLYVTIPGTEAKKGGKESGGSGSGGMSGMSGMVAMGGGKSGGGGSGMDVMIIGANGQIMNGYVTPSASNFS